MLHDLAQDPADIEAHVLFLESDGKYPALLDSLVPLSILFGVMEGAVDLEGYSRFRTVEVEDKVAALLLASDVESRWLSRTCSQRISSATVGFFRMCRALADCPLSSCAGLAVHKEILTELESDENPHPRPSPYDSRRKLQARQPKSRHASRAARRGETPRLRTFISSP